MINSFFGGHALLDALFAHEKVYFAGRATHIAEIGVGQFAQAVDDAAHDCYLHASQMACGSLDTLCGFLEVEESAPAAWASHKLCLDAARACRLQDVEGKSYALVRS